MRTKQTGIVATPQANGNDLTSIGCAGSPVSAATTRQPQLHDYDKQAMKFWLNQSPDMPFSVTTFSLSKKRKRDAQDAHVQDDLWEDRLSTQYEVKPCDKWAMLRKYKKFSVGDESITTGQCILVKSEKDVDDGKELVIAEQWKAKVLEIRALDTEHVYVRVAWLNRPEDFTSGRKEHHGKNELIPTNQMDVIEGISVNGSVEVVHWDDGDDAIGPVGAEQYFWRQTFDFATSKTFSKLRQICIDNKPHNPDEVIVQCSHKECSQWLHAKCIAQQALHRAANAKSTPKRKKAQPKVLNTNASAIATATKKGTKAELFIKGQPDIPDQAARKDEIVITNVNGDRYTEELRCLQCGKKIKD